MAAGAALGNAHPAAARTAPARATSGASDGYEISTVQIGVQPLSIAIDPGAHAVYVGSSSELTIVDEQTGSITGTVPLPGSVVALAVDTATHRVYALEQFPQRQPPGGPTPTAVQASVAVIDPSTRSVITTYPNLGYGPAFPSAGSTLVDDPAGHRLFIASVNGNLNGGQVRGPIQIDTVTGVLTALSSVYAPNSLVYDPSTRNLYVADEDPPRTVTVVSLAGAQRNIASIEVGSRPDGIAVDPAAQTVYVANNDGPSISVVNTRTSNVVATVPAGAILSGLAVNTASHTVFAANGVDGSVTVIDGATSTITATIQTGTPQYRVAVDSTTNVVWTTSLGTSITALRPIVARFAGADRFATAVAISANEYADNQADAVVLARADDFPDALVGAPLAAAKNAPLLFTAGTTLPAATEVEIRRVLAPGKAVYVLGGPDAIPDQVAAQLTALGYHPIRIAGADRFATAVAVADALGDPGTIFLASGSDFPDALTAGPAATKAHGAILLVSPGSVAPETANYLAAHSGTVFAVGAPAALAEPTAIPIFGADRFGTGMAVAQQFFAAATHAGFATGVAFPDALAAGAYMAAISGPLLLTEPTTLSAAIGPYLTGTDATVTSATVFGGGAALSAAVQTSIGVALSR